MKYKIAFIRYIIFLAIISLCFFGLANAQSANDGFAPFMPGASEGVAGQAVTVQRDGKVLFGGGFIESATSRRNLTRLLADGTYDAAFNANVAGVGTNLATVFAVAIQPGATPADDKILIGGDFSNPRSRMARLNLDGSLDTLFNPSITGGRVTDIAVQPADGKILICGLFTSVEGLPRNGIARLNPNGSVDMAFDPNPTGSVKAIKVQNNSQILVVGSFTNIGGAARNNIARLDLNGAADATFNPNANGSVGQIAIMANAIVIGGGFTSVGGIARDKLARLMPDGTVDLNFIPPSITGDISSTAIFSLVVQADGRVIIGGDFLAVGGVPQRSIARLNYNGSLDTGFNPSLAGGNFRTQVYGIAMQQDGKPVITGDFYTVNSLSRLNGARLERSGALDQELPNLLNGSVRAIATQPDGKILIGGQFTSFFGANLVRLNSDGTPDFSFNPTVDANVEAIIIQLDGEIVIGGDFTIVNGLSRNRIARLNSNGTIDGTFNNVDVDSTVFALALQGNKILVGGNFSSVDGVTRNGIARLDTNGVVDSFDPDGFGGVSAIAVQLGAQPADDKILVGGGFSFIGGQNRSYIARLNADGTADGFDPSANSQVEDIAILANGRIMIAGSFTTLAPNGGASVTRSGLARLNSDGSVDTAFANPAANAQVYSVAAQSDGKVIAGGQFTSIGGQTRNRIARLNLDGTVDSFDANANSDVFALAIQTDGKILVGGSFTQIGGQTRNAFARLLNNTSISQRLLGYPYALGYAYTGPGSYHPSVCFSYSTNNGSTWFAVGCATGTSPFPRQAPGKSAASPEGGSPQYAEYTLEGLNLPAGQDLLIRVQAFTSNNGSYDEYIENMYLLAPTAAEVPITGRVTTANGQGVRGVRLTLTSPNGTRRTATTSTFGYYAFDGVEVGQTYVLEIASKRYTFQNPTRVISLQDTLTDVDFTAEPQ